MGSVDWEKTTARIAGLLGIILILCGIIVFYTSGASKYYISEATGGQDIAWELYSRGPTLSQQWIVLQGITVALIGLASCIIGMYIWHHRTWR